MGLKKPKVTIYLGSHCRGDGEVEAIGGAASLLKLDTNCYFLATGHRAASISQMDIVSAIQALKSLKTPHRVHVYTHSELLIKAFKDNLVKRWQHNGWKTSNGHSVQNKMLWESLFHLVSQSGHEVTFAYYKAEESSSERYLTDRLAKLAVDQLEQNVALHNANIIWHGEWETLLAELNTTSYDFTNLKMLAKVSQSYKK